jgi:DNA mismatch repair protein MutS
MVTESKKRRGMAAGAAANVSVQLTLFAPPSPALAALRDIDVESLSPLEALTKLYELKQLAADDPLTGA